MPTLNNIFGSDERRTSIFSVLQTIIFEQNLFVRIQAVDTVINMLDEETKEKTDAIRFQGWLHKILDDDSLNRKIRLVSKFSESIEATMEYYSGQSYINNQELNYDPQLNKQINSINKSINRFAGLVIKELNQMQELNL